MKYDCPQTDPPSNGAVKFRATSVAKKGKYAMENFTQTKIQ